VTDAEIIASFDELIIDIDDLQFVIKNRPLLAHYTSVMALEKIMANDEMWFSNPLFMNDLEEVRFGVQQGLRLFLQSESVVHAAGSAQRAQILRDVFSRYYAQFDQEHAFDTYVFCLSRHDPKNVNGVLSMWRAYGGSGSGAALVFNTNFVTDQNLTSPLIVTKVHYASGESRVQWLNDRLNQWCEKLRIMGLSDEQLPLAAGSFFHLLKFFALKSKHDGFVEEEEWRLIYLPERDREGKFKDKIKFHYVVGPRGVEPKLIFKIQPLDPVQTWKFADILDRIILGPSLSSWLARRGVERMLETVGKREFRLKVSVSQIPLRPPG
jgi:hypothetical protein